MHPLLDQPLVARSVADAGAALVLGRTASVDAITAAARRVLADPSFAEAAGRIGERLRATDGASAAADAVERVADLVSS
jgi:UDP:flavonoid glycosyltransferase YjiC (YdhE family)